MASCGGQSHTEFASKGRSEARRAHLTVLNTSYDSPAQLAEDTTSTGLAPQQQGQGPHVVIGTLRKGGVRQAHGCCPQSGYALFQFNCTTLLAHVEQPTRGTCAMAPDRSLTPPRDPTTPDTVHQTYPYCERSLIAAKSTRASSSGVFAKVWAVQWQARLSNTSSRKGVLQNGVPLDVRLLTIDV